MALPRARRLECEGRRYEWVVRRRGNALRVVVQDVQARGQLLLINTLYFDICLSGDKGGDYYARIPLGPGRLREWINMALRQGWQPATRGLPPFQVDDPGAEDELPQPWGQAGVTLEHVEDLWLVLHAITRDPSWRARLAGTYGEIVPVPPQYVIDIDPDLWHRLQHGGDLQVYRTAWDPRGGDNGPALAIRRNASWVEVFEDVAHWYPRPE